MGPIWAFVVCDLQMLMEMAEDGSYLPPDGFCATKEEALRAAVETLYNGLKDAFEGEEGEGEGDEDANPLAEFGSVEELHASLKPVWEESFDEESQSGEVLFGPEGEEAEFLISIFRLDPYTKA